MRPNRITTGLAGALLLALAVAGCQKKEAPKTADGAVVVKIGQVSPLTGPQAHIGKDNDNGARLAVEEINAQGLMLGGKKVRFEVVSEDDQADPKTATIVAQKLVDAGVKGVIGHLNSGTSIPASKIYHDAGIPQISPSATAIKLTEQGFRSLFRTMTNDRQQGRVLGEYAARKMGKRVAIIDDRTQYGQGLADEVDKAVRAAGGTVVAREFTHDKAHDFLAILTSIKGKNPDVIMYAGMDPQGAPLSRQMQQIGLKARLLGGDGLQTAQFIQLAGAAAEGVTASSPGLPLDNMPGGKAFKEKYTSRYGRIEIYAPYAYDAARAMIEAMKRADSSEPARYVPELAKLSMPGVSGVIAFDDKGDVKGGAITLYRVTGGKWEVLETVSGDDGKKH
jgi:branched-chain amino acid transport system substrate-binding protein